MDVVFEYRLTDGGWAEVDFGVGRAAVKLTARYVGEPLDQLIRAALAIGSGEQRAEAHWEAEGGHRYWWEFSHAPEGVHVRVVRVPRGGGGWQGGQLVDEHCSAHSLFSAIVEAGMRLYLRVGLRDYQEITSTHFPVDIMDDLEAMTSGLSG